MLIKVLVSMSGPSETYTGGQVYEVADERAARLIARGAAEAVEDVATSGAESEGTPEIAEAPLRMAPKRGRRK